MRFLLHRLSHALLLLLAIAAVCFLLLQAVPGDFLTGMRLNPDLSAAGLAALREHYGLDRPLPMKFLRWLGSVARGELGFSFAYNVPASTLLLARSGQTLLLTVTAMLATWALALPLGIWTAAGRRAANRACAGAESLLLAIPDVLLATGALMLALRTGWFPVGGIHSAGAAELGFWARTLDLAHHMLLPVAALVAGALPWVLRHVRASIGEALEAPFVQAARAHGVPRRRLLFRHVLPAAANPLISLFGLSVAGLLSSSLLIEVVIGWPGLGPLLVEALASRDVYVVIDSVLFSAVFLIAGNLLADVLLYAADPRIRRETA